MIDVARLQAYIHKAETELTKNILPFWCKPVADTERGGFHGAISVAMIDRLKMMIPGSGGANARE